jgi:hypothetical protein
MIRTDIATAPIPERGVSSKTPSPLVTAEHHQIAASGHYRSNFYRPDELCDELYAKIGTSVESFHFVASLQTNRNG